MKIYPYSFIRQTSANKSFQQKLDTQKADKNLIEYEKNDFISGIYYSDMLFLDKEQVHSNKINKYLHDTALNDYSSKLFINNKNDAPFKLAAITKKLDSKGKETLIKNNIPAIFRDTDEKTLINTLNTLSYIIRDDFTKLLNNNIEIFAGEKPIKLEYLGKGCNSIVFKLNDGINPPVAMKTYIHPEDISSLSLWGELAVYQETRNDKINNIPELYLANPLIVKVEDKTKEYTEIFDIDELKDYDGYKGGWTIVEYITKDTPVKSEGISFKDWLQRNKLYHLDGNCDNCIGSYVTDLGGISD